MADLATRLSEVMTAMGWTHSDVVRISKQSSSVVSQWLGHGTKEIKTIGKIEAAIYLERASGYSALWIAKGLGAKIAMPQRGTAPPLSTGEPPKSYGPVHEAHFNHASCLEAMGRVLESVPHALRSTFGDVLRGWAIDGGDPARVPVLLALLESPSKQSRAA